MSKMKKKDKRAARRAVNKSVVDMVSSVYEDISDLQSGVAELEEQVYKLQDHFPDTEHFNHNSGPASPPQDTDNQIVYLDEPVRITRHQVESMQGVGGLIMAYDRGNGWLLIGLLDDPEDTSGVWVDQRGTEQHG